MDVAQMTRTWLLPPVVLVLALAGMLALHAVWPGPSFAGPAWQLGGSLLTLGGLGLMVFSAGLFRRRGTAVRPFQESSLLVLEGPYRITRNPMYLGMAMMLTGVGIALGSSIPLVTIPLFVGFITRRFILVEEQLLLARFGSAYEAYRERVRRWL
jgi:protein-S-isoprenylcysteine O-methyltransferase Ste14